MNTSVTNRVDVSMMRMDLDIAPTGLSIMGVANTNNNTAVVGGSNSNHMHTILGGRVVDTRNLSVDDFNEFFKSVLESHKKCAGGTFCMHL